MNRSRPAPTARRNPYAGRSELVLESYSRAAVSIAQTTARKATRAIRDRANKFEAHKDKKQMLGSEPNFNDVDKAVAVICDLYKKYYYLLKQSSLSI